MRKNLFVSLLFVIMLCITANCFAADEFKQGVKTDSYYINDSIGIRVDLGEDFVMATDSEMRELMGIGLDMVSSSSNYDLDQIASFFDMMATNPLEGSTVMIGAEKLLLSGITMKQYITAYENNLNGAFQTTMVSDDGTVNVCGREWNELVYTVDVQNMTILYLTYLTKIGNRMVSISFSGLSDESVFKAADLVSCVQ